MFLKHRKVKVDLRVENSARWLSRSSKAKALSLVAQFQFLAEPFSQKFWLLAATNIMIEHHIKDKTATHHSSSHLRCINIGVSRSILKQT